MKKFVNIENIKTQKNIECITTKGRRDNQMVGKKLNKYKSISKYNKYEYTCYILILNKVSGMNTLVDSL